MSSSILEEKNFEEFFKMIAKGVKLYADPTGHHKGDIILDEGVSNITYEKIVFRCPVCNAEYQSKRGLGIHLKDTVDIDHMWIPKRITSFLDRYQGIKKLEQISKADIYYFVVEPREIPELPSSVEVDIRGYPTMVINPYTEKQEKVLKIPKGTKPPTPLERERRDREMEKWRKDMKDLSKRKEVLPQINPRTGTFEETGPSGNYWHWRPEVWKHGQWFGVAPLDLPLWRKKKHRTLQLYVICPIE